MTDAIMEKDCCMCGKTFIARPEHTFKIRTKSTSYKWFCGDTCKQQHDNKQELKYYLSLIKRMEQQYINYEEKKPKTPHYYNLKLTDIGSKVYCKYFKKIEGLEILASANIALKQPVLQALNKVKKHLKSY